MEVLLIDGNLAKESAHQNHGKRMTANLKDAHNSFIGIGVDLFKSISHTEGLLRFPLYYTTFSTYDKILCFSWFPSSSYYHSNGDAKHFVLDNVRRLSRNLVRHLGTKLSGFKLLNVDNL